MKKVALSSLVKSHRILSIQQKLFRENYIALDNCKWVINRIKLFVCVQFVVLCYKMLEKKCFEFISTVVILKGT